MATKPKTKNLPPWMMKDEEEPAPKKAPKKANRKPPAKGKR